MYNIDVVIGDINKSLKEIQTKLISIEDELEKLKGGGDVDDQV